MANNNTNNTRPFLTSCVGTTAKGVPYAIQLEGYIASAAPYFKEATDDKKAFLSFSIGLRGSAARLMALADGTYEKGKEYGEKGEDGLEKDEFCDLHLYGTLAEKMSKVLVKGRRVVVSGPMKMEEYDRKDGSKGTRLVVNVDNIIDGGSRKNGVDPTVASNIAVVTTTFTGKDGVTRSTPMAATVSGTVIGAGELKNKNGTDYLQFGIRTGMSAEKIVALADGTYDKDKEYDGKKTIINATVFGKTAERLAKVIRDGAIVVVSGPAEANEYDGKISYQIRPRNNAVTVLKYPETEAAASVAGSAAADAAPAPTSDEGYFAPIAEDEGDELPF